MENSALIIQEEDAFYPVGLRMEEMLWMFWCSASNVKLFRIVIEFAGRIFSCSNEFEELFDSDFVDTR